MNQELAQIVVAALATYGKKNVRSIIRDAHNGKLFGYVVTPENQHLFRRFRNTVSGDPEILIKQAQAFQGGQS